MNKLFENWRRFMNEEDEQDTIIGIPGGFKPPHKGHVAMINHYLEKYPKAKIVIYMGSKPRHDSTKTMEFNIEQSKKVFKLYFQKGALDPSRVKLKDKVKQRPKKAGGHYENPMSDIIELVGDTSLAGSRVGMGYAAKEKHYGSTFMKGSGGYSAGVQAFDPGPAEWGTALQGISATRMRNAIKNENLKTISEMIPDGISAEEYLALFK